MAALRARTAWCAAWTALAVFCGWWAIGLAVYRADDFLAVGGAWANGSASDALDAGAVHAIR